MEHPPLIWNDAAELGRIIRATRVAQDLRQEDLAFAAGVSRALLNQVEQGKPTARLDGILAIAMALGLTPAFLPARANVIGAV